MPEVKKKDITAFLTLRNARDLIILCLIAVATWKLLDSDISISIKEVAFSDLLALFVAFFAIALSIAFYFKATDTSNRFYENSYKFTKEISEILGRIEAGFGEKLKHIDEGYVGIRDRFDQLPFDANKAKEEIEAEKLEIEKKKKEQSDLLENLAQKAKLAVTEKKELFKQIEKSNKELETAKSDLRRMQINMLKHEVVTKADPKLKRKVTDYLAQQIRDRIPSGLENEVSLHMIQEIYSDIKEDLHSNAIEDLMATDIIDEDLEFTDKGIRYMRFKVGRSL